MVKVNLPAPVPVIEPQKTLTVHLAPQPKLTNAFETSKAPTTSSHANVYSVRFGVSQIDPNATHSAHVAPVGSMFGTTRGGEERGVVGRVASSGFGGAGARNGQVKAQGQVKNVGFSAPTILPTATPVHPNVEQTPVLVTNKPIPQYTEEAKRLRIQGKVVIEATFTAAGSVVIVRIVHGLGHGLDEQAERAAKHIQFKPATKNGVPVSVTTEIDIQFELA
jgi:TonB family protein